MGNKPFNRTDPDGGLTVGLGGAIGGTVVGGIIAGLIIKNNPKMDGLFKFLLAAGLPTVGAGIGYSITESLYPGTQGKTWTNPSKNLWGNFRAFYAGLFGEESITTKSGYTNGHPVPPNINLFGWTEYFKGLQIDFIKVLPYWDLWGQRKMLERPPVDVDDDGKDESWGFIYRMDLTFIHPVWPTYLLLREIIRVPRIRHRKKNPL
jgi:hypothetical protein